MNLRVHLIAAVICVCLSGFASGAHAAGRFNTPVVIGDSWSNSYWDWPGSTTAVLWSQYRIHAISGDWMSAKNVQTQQGMVLNISGYLDLNPDADSLIIQGGINDIFNGVDAATIKAALTSIFAEAKSRPNIIDILVISPGPFGGVPSGWTQAKQDELEDYLGWLPGYTESEGIDLYLVYYDVNHKDYSWIIKDGTNGEPNYSNDGLHLNEPGVDRMALGVDAAINRIRSRPLQVELDIEPWSTSNTVKPDSNDSIFVAVKGSRWANGGNLNFDVDQINPDTLKFGPTEAPNIAVPLWGDLDNDTHEDVVFAFKTQATGVLCADTELTLRGETTGGVAFEGTDAINTAECATDSCHP